MEEKTQEVDKKRDLVKKEERAKAALYQAIENFNRQFNVKVRKTTYPGLCEEDGEIILEQYYKVDDLITTRILESTIFVDVDGPFRYDGRDQSENISCLLEVHINHEQVGEEGMYLQGEYDQQNNKWTMTWEQ